MNMYILYILSESTSLNYNWSKPTCTKAI